MKKSLRIILITTCCLLCTATSVYATEKEITITVKNNWNKAKTNEPIVININDLNTEFPVYSATVWDNSTEIPSQLDDFDKDHINDELAFLIDLPAKSKKMIKIKLSSEKSEKKYPQQVHAQMLISDKRGKHVPITSLTIPGTSNVYNQLHHHGPAFESELVAYRIYFDQKQTVDIYGKFNKGFEIEASGFYPNDEQLAKGFGDDVLRVSGSCGVGALKGWNGTKATHIEPVDFRTESIISYGPIRTIVDVKVDNWKYQNNELTMINRYTLYGGHRDVQVDVIFKEPLKQEVFCTGVQNIKGSDSFSDHKGLIACWGTDWPVNDTVKYAKETVGLATCIPQKYVVKETQDKANYLYLVQAQNQKSFTYHITFTSLKETFGYKTKEEWFKHVQEWKDELEHPCIVEFK